jgi:transcriptional regulator with XRE-family HTH domain
MSMGGYCQHPDSICQASDAIPWQRSRMDKTIAENARFARTRAGFNTPEKARKKIGCSRTLLLAWEKDGSSIRGSKYLLDAALAYRVRPEWLAKNEGQDGYPWDGSRTVQESPSAATAESPDTDIQALNTALTGVARVLAATIPTLGRALEDEVAGFPPELKGHDFVAVLLKTIRQQNAENDQLAAKAKKRSRT